jgi:hypothetical protein
MGRRGNRRPARAAGPDTPVRAAGLFSDVIRDAHRLVSRFDGPSGPGEVFPSSDVQAMLDSLFETRYCGVKETMAFEKVCGDGPLPATLSEACERVVGVLKGPGSAAAAESVLSWAGSVLSWTFFEFVTVLGTSQRCFSEIQAWTGSRRERALAVCMCGEVIAYGESFLSGVSLWGAINRDRRYPCGEMQTTQFVLDAACAHMSHDLSITVPRECAWEPHTFCESIRRCNVIGHGGRLAADEALLVADYVNGRMLCRALCCVPGSPSVLEYERQFIESGLHAESDHARSPAAPGWLSGTRHVVPDTTRGVFSRVTFPLYVVHSPPSSVSVPGEAERARSSLVPKNNHELLQSLASIYDGFHEAPGGTGSELHELVPVDVLTRFARVETLCEWFEKAYGEADTDHAGLWHAASRCLRFISEHCSSVSDIPSNAQLYSFFQNMGVTIKGAARVAQRGSASTKKRLGAEFEQQCAAVFGDSAGGGHSARHRMLALLCSVAVSTDHMRTRFGQGCDDIGDVVKDIASVRELSDSVHHLSSSGAFSSEGAVLSKLLGRAMHEHSDVYTSTSAHVHHGLVSGDAGVLKEHVHHAPRDVVSSAAWFFLKACNSLDDEDDEEALGFVEDGVAHVHGSFDLAHAACFSCTRMCYEQGRHGTRQSALGMARRCMRTWKMVAGSLKKHGSESGEGDSAYTDILCRELHRMLCTLEGSSVYMSLLLALISSPYYAPVFRGEACDHKRTALEMVLRMRYDCTAFCGEDTLNGGAYFTHTSCITNILPALQHPWALTTMRCDGFLGEALKLVQDARDGGLKRRGLPASRRRKKQPETGGPRSVAADLLPMTCEEMFVIVLCCNPFLHKRSLAGVFLDAFKDSSPAPFLACYDELPKKYAVSFNVNGDTQKHADEYRKQAFHMEITMDREEVKRYLDAMVDIARKAKTDPGEAAVLCRSL